MSGKVRSQWWDGTRHAGRGRGWAQRWKNSMTERVILDSSDLVSGCNPGRHGDGLLIRMRAHRHDVRAAGPCRRWTW